MPSKHLCIRSWLERAAPCLFWSLPSIRTRTALRGTICLRFRANSFLLKDLGVYSSPSSSCIYSRFSSSSQQSPSRPSSFQAHFAHVSIPRPSLLLLMSCRSTFVQHDSLESPRLPTLYNVALRLSWTCLFLLQLFTLSLSSTSPSTCGSPFTLL